MAIVFYLREYCLGSMDGFEEPQRLLYKVLRFFYEPQNRLEAEQTIGKHEKEGEVKLCRTVK